MKFEFEFVFIVGLGFVPQDEKTFVLIAPFVLITITRK